MPRANRFPSNLTSLAACLALSLIAAVGCTGGGGDGTTDTTTADGFKPVINLAVNDWTASALNAAIAEALVERHLGYPVVPVRVDDTTAMYQDLADGRLDVVLEVWPSAISERDRRFFDRGQLVELGPLGSVGKIGWFVPRYVIDEMPELTSWTGFQDPGVAARFAPVDSAPPGQFLGVLPSYRQHDEEIIANLGLPLQVEYSGSEEGTLAALAEATAAGRPILVYWWRPTAAIVAYDLVEVTLPEPNPECLASAQNGDGGVDCGYPPEDLLKIASPQLAGKAPEVEAFLRSFTISTGDQQAMLAAVEVDGRSIAAVAAGWIEGNESLWRPWLDG